MDNVMKLRESKVHSKIIRIIDMKKLEKNIPRYIIWLKRNKREDRIDNYKEFLQV